MSACPRHDDGKHKHEHPAFIRQLVDYTATVFNNEPRTYTGEQNPPVIYGFKCACGDFRATLLTNELEAKELAKARALNERYEVNYAKGGNHATVGISSTT